MTIIDHPTTDVRNPGSARRAVLLERFADVCTRPAPELSLGEIRTELSLARSVKAMADARVVELNQQLRVLAQIDPVDPESELQSFAGLRARDIKVVTAQTAAVDVAPSLGALLAEGATTASHVEAVGRALVTAGDGKQVLLDQVDTIVDNAKAMPVAEFDTWVNRLARRAQPDEGLSRLEQQQRRTSLKTWRDHDGMTRAVAAFDPVRGAVFEARINQMVEQMFHAGEPIEVAPGVEPNDHRRALALYALVTQVPGVVAEPGTAIDVRPARAELVVHVDLTTLRTGLHERGICRTAQGADIPPETARRIACDADIIPVVLDGHGVPIDVGRAKRLATVHQRRALETMYDTCAIDGCTVAFQHCTVHHLNPWENGGTTDMVNLLPLCSKHHHAAHEGGWRLHLDPTTRRLHVTLPAAPTHDPP